MRRSIRIHHAPLIAALALAVSGAGCKESAKPLPKAPHDAAPAAAPMVVPDNMRPVEAVAVAPCPIAVHSAEDADAFLDVASERYEAGDFAAAYHCAEKAADLLPRSVYAHHIRAASAAALGHHELARLAFALALAMDPDDPETLAAAAELYISVLRPAHPEYTRIGLEYARRGRARAVVRRGIGKDLRAHLALLEAMAYNDLGQSDDAIERIEEVLELVPGSPASESARYERGLALFQKSELERARDDLAAVLASRPHDPYVHHYMGLVGEYLDGIDSAAHLRRARELAPEEFPEPVLLSPAEFDSAVKAAIAALPEDSRQALAHVPLEIADLPDLADLKAASPPLAPTILGLFRGLPHGMERNEAPAVPMPDRAIVLYRKNLARAVRTRAELDEQIRRTLLHELGHLRGLDENDLRRLGLD